MKYKVYIQDNFVIEIDAADTDDALNIVATQITNGEISYNILQPMNLRLEPVHE